MAKKNRRKRRSAFPEAAKTAENRRKAIDRQYDSFSDTGEQLDADVPTGDIHGYFRDVGVRETIESVVIAIILALMFRAFEAEAFIIPTGSMAPSLQGKHMDLECGNCGYRYFSGASSESKIPGYQIDSTICPICQYRTRMSPNEPDHKSNNGDRILVNKFIYDFASPERYDVIVFKNPNQGNQNFIKRLIGLPGENILIENGDIYLMELQSDQSWKKQITRKPARKLRHILQDVDDTYHIGQKLKSVNWPSRWQSFADDASWKVDSSGETPTFSSQKTAETNWLRYRHYQPRFEEWPTIKNGDLPGRFGKGLPPGHLISDKYGYNGGVYELDTNPLGDITSYRLTATNYGLHWVGDLGVEADVAIKSDSGQLTLDLVEGGAHFQCTFDIATGMATLGCDDSQVKTKVTFVDENGSPISGSPEPVATRLKGAGNYQLLFVNADDRLHLWVNNQHVEFPVASFNRVGIPIPTYSASDPGDAEPAGIGAKDLDIEIDRLKVVRDIYYVSTTDPRALEDETMTLDPGLILALQANPKEWSNPAAIQQFEKKKGKKEPMFFLEDKANDEKDQYLPMGDNSPRSSDGRVWDGPKYVERDMLIGRAILIYWPHAKNKPIPFFPNFERMGFIR
ncbi:MAG: signal peptidase I [Planctomycetota bacterium]